MVPSSRRPISIARISTAVLSPLLIAALVLVSLTSQRVLVHNRTDQPLAVHVSVKGKTVLDGSLPPGGAFSTRYWATAEAEYNIVVQYRDGRRISRDLGYIAPFATTDHDILILRDDIRMRPWRD